MLRQVPRHMHPGAWWLWCLGMATGATRTSNPIVLGLIVAICAVVVNERQSPTLTVRPFTAFLKLGLLVIAFRTVFQLIVDLPVGYHVLFVTPSVPLPAWMASLRLGGDITLESLIIAVCFGLQLATILICIGAANALGPPNKLMKSLPSALYALGVSIVVALTFAPQVLAEIARIRTARRLRGRSTTRVAGSLASILPTVDSSLRRCIGLAATMDSRGYGRRAGATSAQVAITSLLLVLGLCGTMVAVFALMAAVIPSPIALALGLCGIACALLGMWRSGRRVIRSHYRPIPWRGPEWLLTFSGAVVVGAFANSSGDDTALTIAVTPLQWPTLPATPTVAMAFALVAALLTPASATGPTVIDVTTPTRQRELV